MKRSILAALVVAAISFAATPALAAPGRGGGHGGHHGGYHSQGNGHNGGHHGHHGGHRSYYGGHHSGHHGHGHQYYYARPRYYSPGYYCPYDSDYYYGRQGISLQFGF